MIYGVERLKHDLESLGFEADLAKGSDNHTYVIITGFVIPAGRFMGRTVDVGIMGIPNYPQGVPSALHIRSEPHLLDISDTLANVRNILASPLGDEWRYWSKNFNWNGEKSTRRLISQINRIFEDA